MGCHHSVLPSSSSEANVRVSSPFRRWVDTVNGGRKATLRQEFQLALALYKQAWERRRLQRRRFPTVQELIRLVHETPFQHDDNLVSWQGIQVGWFVNVFCTSPYLQELQNFGCEAWFVRKVGVVVLVAMAVAHHSTGQQPPLATTPAGTSLVEHVSTISHAWGLSFDPKRVIQKPTIFVSYTGAYTWDHVVRTLQQLHPHDVIWLDILCVNQFAWTGRRRRSATNMEDEQKKRQCEKQFMDDLVQQIRSIGQTALLLDKWHNVMATLSQIWVLWEIFTTTTTSAQGNKLHVLFGPLQVRDSVDLKLETWDDAMLGVSQALQRDIDVNHAHAGDDGDRRAILDRMRTSGLEQVNAEVRAVMLEWLTQHGWQRLAQRRRQQSITNVPTKLLHNFAQLLWEQGRIADAECIYRQALERRRRELGHHHPATLASLCHLARALYAQDKLGEATTLYRQVLAVQRKTLGNKHAHTLWFVKVVAILLHQQGQVPEAEPLYREAWEGRRQLLQAKDNPLNYDNWEEATNHLASILYSQGKLAEAEALLWDLVRVGAARRRPFWYDVYNPNNYWTCLHNLATLLWYNHNRLDDAEPLLWEAVEGRRRKLGSGHPDTLSSMATLLVVLHRQQQQQQPLLPSDDEDATERSEDLVSMLENFAPSLRSMLLTTYESSESTTSLWQQGRPSSSAQFLRSLECPHSFFLPC